MHEEIRHMPRIRAVLDCVAEVFRRGAIGMDPGSAEGRRLPGHSAAEVQEPPIIRLRAAVARSSNTQSRGSAFMHARVQ